MYHTEYIKMKKWYKVWDQEYNSNEPKKADKSRVKRHEKCIESEYLRTTIPDTYGDNLIRQ